ncbi:MAG TPA: cytochrome oxidase subunit III, partial [Cryomorphaceae bacterium]|nr:cytochrome oxidase subunit III [Cryomorphaceae bacterium]
MASTAEMTKEENHWGGASRPLGARYGKLMMWFFLLSDALTFSGFLTAYGLMRFKYEKTWPIAE